MAKAKDSVLQRLPLPTKCACCDDPGPMVMSPGCHMGKPVYGILTGNILTMECSVCHQVVGRFEVTCMVKLGEA